MLPKGFLDTARHLIAANTVSANGTLRAADLLQPLWEQAGLRVHRQVVDEIHVNLIGGDSFPSMHFASAGSVGSRAQD